MHTTPVMLQPDDSREVARMMMLSARPILRPKEMADLLGVCENTLRKLNLPSVKINGLVMYIVRDVLEELSRRQFDTAESTAEWDLKFQS